MPASFGSLVQQAGDILVADAKVTDPSARFKLPVWLRANVQSVLDSAHSLSGQQSQAEGTRRLDSREVQSAYENGETLIRQISKWLNSLDEDDNIPAQRAFYGFGPNLPATMRHEEVEQMLEKFVAAQAMPLNPDAVLSASRLAKVQAALLIIETKGDSASVGTRAGVTDQKEAAQDALEEAIARVRYFLWATFPQMFRDPMLHQYGFVPRQEPEAEKLKPPTV